MIDFTYQKAEDSALNLLKTHYLLENTLPTFLLPSTVDAYISTLLLKVSKYILLGFNFGADSSKRHENRLGGQGSTYQ